MKYLLYAFALFLLFSFEANSCEKHKQKEQQKEQPQNQVELLEKKLEKEYRKNLAENEKIKAEAPKMKFYVPQEQKKHHVLRESFEGLKVTKEGPKKTRPLVNNILIP